LSDPGLEPSTYGV